MKTEHVKLQGLRGTWYMIDNYCTPYGTYYLWESEQYGDEYGAVLTDEYLTIIDYCCESDILTAMYDNGILIDETDQEDEAVMDEFEDWLLLAGLDY